MRWLKLPESGRFLNLEHLSSVTTDCQGGVMLHWMIDGSDAPDRLTGEDAAALLLTLDSAHYARSAAVGMAQVVDVY